MRSRPGLTVQAPCLEGRPFTRQRLTLHGGSRRASREAGRPSGRSSALLPVDHRIEDAEGNVLHGGWRKPSRLIPASMRAHGLVRPAKRCELHAVFRSPSVPMAVALRRRGSPFSLFPCAHRATWPSPTRERVLRCARLPASMRRHGRRPPGRGQDPSACLSVPLWPHGCPRSRHGYILHVYWQHPSGHMGARLAPRGASFPDRRRRSCPMGASFTSHGCVPPLKAVTDRPCRRGPSRDRGHRSVGGGHRSWVKDVPLRVRGSPVHVAAPSFTRHRYAQADVGRAHHG
jgi:hypothetical protein